MTNDATILFFPERAVAVEMRKKSVLRLQGVADSIIECIAENKASFRGRTQEENDALLVSMLSQAGNLKAQEKSDIKNMVAHAFLLTDDVQTCEAIFASRIVDQWFFGNIAVATANCPQVISAWRRNGRFGCSLIMQHIAKESDRWSDDQKITILSGRSNDPLHSMAPELLAWGIQTWACLSPQWIGPEGSGLRSAAVNAGWHHCFLLDMVWRNIEHGYVPWLNNIRYPYSILACKWIANAMSKGARHKSQEGSTTIEYPMQKGVSPLDAALAINLLAHSPVYTGYVLVGHGEEERVVDVSMRKVISALMHLRATHLGMAALTNDICEGTVFDSAEDVVDIEHLL